MEHSRLSPTMEQIENQIGQPENLDVAPQNASKSDQQALGLILKLCTALRDEDINYCHWKSNNALDRSANGENDIDLLISRSDAGRFSELLYRFGFKQAKAPPDKQMPGVLDYYGYDEDSNKWVHVHAHYQLIMGDDMTKNFRFAIEEPYLKSVVWDGIFKVPAVEFEFVVFVIRMVLNSDAFAQNKKTNSSKSGASAYKFAYEHGYRAGYEDGYAQGKADVGRPQLRDFGQNDLYARADRAYQQRMGLQIEYQEGYRSGFEIAYSDGYFGRTHSTAIPSNLGRVVTGKLNASLSTSPSPSVSSSTVPSAVPSADASTSTSTGTSTADTATASTGQANPPVTDDRRDQGAYSESGSRSGSGAGSASGQGAYSERVPNAIQLKIRLQDRISTKDSKEGDRFTAVVLDPSTFAEAQVVGHIAKLKKAGNIKGKTELQLSFDSLTLRDGRTLGLTAQVERVYESKGVKQTDEEGNVQTGDRTNDAILRSGSGAVLGAIIGGIAGGGKGAGIGAAIGAGAGIGSVYIDGGKNLTLESGTEILIRTSGPIN